VMSWIGKFGASYGGYHRKKESPPRVVGDGYSGEELWWARLEKHEAIKFSISYEA